MDPNEKEVQIPCVDVHHPLVVAWWSQVGV